MRRALLSFYGSRNHKKLINLNQDKPSSLGKIDLVVKHHYKEDVTAAELAVDLGFTPKEVDMLKVFWKSCFNKGWILLTCPQ